MGYHIWKDSVGYWRWYLVGHEFQRVANSANCFFNREACIQSVQQAMDAGRETKLFED